MKNSLLCALLCFASLLAGQTQSAQRRWTLTWSDEFNGRTGSSFDATKWTAEIGGHGWGNHELQFYTARPENIFERDGSLVFVARREEYVSGDNTWHYTSARLKTFGKFSQKYGKFEARIRIPAGQGMWPAFFMLGDDIGQNHWPSCGEIDVMENIGREPLTVHGTLHGPGYSGLQGIGSPFQLVGPKPVSSDFHRFSVEWEPSSIRFYVDDVLYETRTPTDLPSGAKWVYDHPFFLILNLAVGGDWPGAPDQTTQFPQEMLVDYVRVYSAER